MTSCRPPLWVRDLLPSGIFGIQPWIYEIQILGLFAYARFCVEKQPTLSMIYWQHSHPNNFILILLNSTYNCLLGQKKLDQNIDVGWRYCVGEKTYFSLKSDYLEVLWLLIHIFILICNDKFIKNIFEVKKWPQMTSNDHKLIFIQKTLK